MSETSTSKSPNVAQNPGLEQQVSIVLGEIMDNPQKIGANVDDGSYSKSETENEVREKIDIGTEHSGTKLRVSRQREHDPGRHVPGKFVEAMDVYADIPGVAQVTLAMVGGKIQAVEYSDQFSTKDGLDGLENALEAIKLAVEELHSRTS